MTDGLPTVDRVRLCVANAAVQHPRHQQVAIGPSEIGTPCDRRLMYRAMGTTGHDSFDPWPSIVGIAVHAWLADAFTAENRRLGRRRYLVEERVQLTDGIGGTCDLYDCDASEVIDHKVLGAESMRKVKHSTIIDDYRTQVHLYAYGLARAGWKPRTVGLVAYPRGGTLAGLAAWSEPYSIARAEDALDRLSRLVAIGYVMRLDEPRNPLWEAIPASPGERCAWCPFWRPGAPADTSGCPGPL